MSDAERLAAHTHLSQSGATQLLESRTLTGDPEEHSHPAILLTENEVIVETQNAFTPSSTPSAIELAFTSGARVEQLRLNRDAFRGD